MKKKNFKVGDKVYIATMFDNRIETIEKETKTKFYTKNFAFYKKDNSIVGDKSYKIEKATQEHFNIFKRKKIIRDLNGLDFNTLDFSALKSIYELTKYLDILEKGRIAKHLNKVKFNTLNLDILEKIYKLITK